MTAGVWFNFFDKDEEGVVSEGFSEYPYLLLLMKKCPGYCNNQLESIITKVYSDNETAIRMVFKDRLEKLDIYQ